MTKRDENLLSSGAAAELLGLTTAKFRRLVTKLALVPDGTYVNPHYRSGPSAHLWHRDNVERLRTTEEYTAILAAPPPKRLDWDAKVAEKYGSPEAAIPDAARALFSLNMYTRHDKCGPSNREEIRSLKAAFVTALYKAEKFTDRVEALVRKLPEKECYGCEATGTTEWGEDCDRCRGTGIYLPAKEVRSYAFHFSIAGEHYCWVEPDFAIGFVPKVEETRAATPPRELDTAIDLPTGTFVEAKALIRFATRYVAPMDGIVEEAS